jgi:hypothetical protein
VQQTQGNSVNEAARQESRRDMDIAEVSICKICVRGQRVMFNWLNNEIKGLWKYERDAFIELVAIIAVVVLIMVGGAW